MKCVICKHGETTQGLTSVALERGNATLVFKSVPAFICENCGEEYIDQSVTRQLLAVSEQSALTGVQVDIRQYSPQP